MDGYNGYCKLVNIHIFLELMLNARETPTAELQLKLVMTNYY